MTRLGVGFRVSEQSAPISVRHTPWEKVRLFRCCLNAFKRPWSGGLMMDLGHIPTTAGKRKHEDEAEQGPATRRPAKRQRRGGRVHLFHLSDELLLRTLSFLQLNALTRCECVCRKLRSLARDNELWREKYFNHFVRPRARRIPALQSMPPEEQEQGALRYSSRKARWLEHSTHVQAGSDTNWKHLFKVKYNWMRGRARRSEVAIGNSPTTAILAQVHKGKLITADRDRGLCIWKEGVVLHACPLQQGSGPTAMVVESEPGHLRTAIGFDQGSTSIFAFDGHGLSEVAAIESASPGAITSVALVWPYLMTMSKARCISLYRCDSDNERRAARLLVSLNTEADLSPAALTLRRTKTTLIAGIAYAFHRFNAGWCLGLQEIRMDLSGTITDNRTTSSVSTPIRDTLLVEEPPRFTSRSASTSPFSLHPELMRAPNSLSYNGCYILAGLPDNTLMVYTVTSTDNRLEINVGRRLWGHTSAVSAAEVTSTGKALSISAKSDEMRYWELEEILGSYSQKKTSTPIQPFDVLDEAMKRRNDGLGLALKAVKKEAQLYRKRVSFDDEQAIVVGERDQRQIISCFDFA